MPFSQQLQIEFQMSDVKPFGFVCMHKVAGA